MITNSIEDNLICEKENNISFVCPDCQSNNTIRNGRSPQGKQKYKCKNCSKTKTGIITRNTLVFSSKNHLAYYLLLQDLCLLKTLRKSVLIK